MTDEEVEKIIKRNMNLQMNLAGIRADFEEASQRQWVGLTDEEIWKFWWSRPEVPDGEDDSMEAEFVSAVRRVLAAHGIKE